MTNDAPLFAEAPEFFVSVDSGPRLQYYLLEQHGLWVAWVPNGHQNDHSATPTPSRRLLAECSATGPDEARYVVMRDRHRESTLSTCLPWLARRHLLLSRHKNRCAHEFGHR